MRPPLPRSLSAAAAVFGAIASISCSSEKAAGPIPVPVDSTPPVVLHFIGPDEGVNPGSEFEVRFRARDAVGIKSATLTVYGAFTDSISGDFDGAPAELDAYAFLYVPNGSPIDQRAVATLTVFDAAGNKAHAETRIAVRDTRPPLVRLDLGGLHFDGSIRTGEVLEVYINAEDNHRLKYIGYEGGTGIRDSVLATSMGDSHAFRVTVPESWVVNRPLLRPWARDASGNVTDVTNNSARHVPVYNWVVRDITTWLLPTDEGAKVLWDAKRNSVYRLRYHPEAASSTLIDGVAVSSGAFLPPVTLPNYPHDFTFSASGDSLVVIPFPDGSPPTLGIVDLLSTPRSISQFTLQYDLYTAPRGPWVARAVGDHFFVGLMSGQYGSRLLDIDFATGAQVIRTDIDGRAEIPNYPSLLRLPDGRLVVGAESPSYWPDFRYIYSPASNAFVPTQRLRNVSSRNYSASPSGRFMMGNTLYGATFDSVTTVATQDWDTGPMALSPDGQTVYLSTLYGYQKLRLSDGAVLEQVRLPERPWYLFVVADGTKLIAVSESAVRAIDLR